MTSLQERYDNLKTHLDAANEQVKMYKNSIKDLEKEAKEQGLFLKDDKFVKPGYKYIHVYAEMYYDRYVGEKGAMYDGMCGMQEFTEEKYNLIIKAIKDKDIDTLYTTGILDEYGIFEKEFLDSVEIKENGNIKFLYEGNDDMEEYSPGSGFVIAKVKEDDNSYSSIKNKEWSFTDSFKIEYDNAWNKAEEFIKSI